QLQVQTLLNRCAELRVANSTLEAALQSKHRGKGRKPKDIDSVLASHQERIVLFGKRWAIMVEPWINPAIFMQTFPPDTSPAISIPRFESIASYRAGDLMELGAYLNEAPDLKEFAEKISGFRDEFVKQVGNERSISLRTIREAAPFIFPELEVPPTIWAAGAGSDRGSSQLLKSLLYPPNKPKSRLSPIFFPDRNSRNSSLIFMNEFQPRVSMA
ncbi:hypothetical protein K435DRAFT_706304, partial [Dendrothele bispora CBS 962.96]